jgi:hypothetical protein
MNAKRRPNDSDPGSVGEIDNLLSKGQIVGHRSRREASKYLPDLKKHLGLAETPDVTVDPALEQFLAQAVLGAAWYEKKYHRARWWVWIYVVVNVAVVLALPIGLILVGHAARSLNVNVLASQVTGVLTGVLALQKTLSAWYACRQQYAAWYKAGADLKSIYYEFVSRWSGKASVQGPALLRDCANQTDAARKIIDAEELDFYQHLVLPTFDVLDMLTSTRATVSSFVTSLLPGEQPITVSMVGRTALVGPVGGAPPGPETGPGPNAASVSSARGVIVHTAGAAKPNDNPYTIVIVANPVLQTYTGSAARDPIVQNPTTFGTVVQNTINVLFGDIPGQAEKFMAPFRGQIRIVSIFDPNVEILEKNALVGEKSGSQLFPIWQHIPDFLKGYQVNGKPIVADVAIAVTSSPQFQLSGSWPALDDQQGGGIPFSLDTDRFMHAYRSQVPGTTALHSQSSPTTALHEFSHAASSWNNGYVFDLYNDYGAGNNVIILNKRWARPIPGNFGSYDGVMYKSDLMRGPLAYDPNWRSFHCELADPHMPALMDEYKEGHPPEACRHDKITAAFLTDRIKAIMSRP